MIPVKLKIHNFMCYRDNPPLHFDGIHLACLSGDNGNGKSALIDAITWALWGETRARSDDDLVYTGQTEMEVEFDFAIGGQRYRIIRKHAKPKRLQGSGQTSLDLLIAGNDGFKVISADKIKQTQQNIISILHMDYDTFINSAYLRQGHADEFTRQAPARRKEVLSNILGLSYYDELEEQAKELARKQENLRNQTESAIERINSELTLRPTFEAELERLLSELSEVDKIIKEKQSTLDDLKAKKESLDRKQALLEQLRLNVHNIAGELGLWEEQVKKHKSKVQEFEELISRRSAIEDGYARFLESRKLSDELYQKSRKASSISERKHQLEMTIYRKEQSIITDHALAKGKIAELENKLRKLPELRNQLNQSKAQLNQFADKEALLGEQRKACQELQSRVTYLESDKAQRQREISEIDEKLNLLATQTEAECPLCERPLEIEGLNLIKSKYIAERQVKSDLLKSHQAETAQIMTKLASLTRETSTLESRLNEQKTNIAGRISVLTKEIVDCQEAQEQLTSQMKRVAEIEELLARRDFASAEQKALNELEVELDGLGYRPEQHDEVRRRLAETEQYDHQQRMLAEAERLIAQERQSALSTEELVEKLWANLELDNQKIEELSKELNSLPGLLSDLNDVGTQYRGLAEQKNMLQEKVWSSRAKLQRCNELDIERKQKEVELVQFAKEEEIYKELSRAFGKGGIQALLIEMALPEIENEANRLLSRMTDNRMHVKFETQRETKKGELAETLDIKISDELGTRNYEMFSGGEAFRVNFAVRIALSRVLARRSGAPLPTLIIDEGFGTQDSAGIDRLKESIISIQEDFEKIIVITHIEELRDAFPTRIDVVKTPEGSTFSVN